MRSATSGTSSFPRSVVIVAIAFASSVQLSVKARNHCRVSPILAGQWFLAFTDSWTLEANAMATITTLRGKDEVPLVAERILLRRPDAVVVVRREELAAVRRAVGPELAPGVYGL